MTLYCKIVGGAIVAREQKDSPEVATGQDGNPVWRPFVANAAPSYDPTTYHPPVRSEMIEATQVVETWADPVAKTAQEIDDAKVALAAGVADQGLAKVALLIIAGQFQLVKAANGGSLTVDQYFAWLASNPTIPLNTFIQKIKALL